MRRRQPLGAPIGAPPEPPDLAAADEPIEDVGAAMAQLANASDTIGEHLRDQAAGVLDQCRGVNRELEEECRGQILERLGSAAALDERLEDEIKTFARGRLHEPVEMARRMGDRITAPWQREPRHGDEQEQFDSQGQPLPGQPSPGTPGQQAQPAAGAQGQNDLLDQGGPFVPGITPGAGPMTPPTLVYPVPGGSGGLIQPYPPGEGPPGLIPLYPIGTPGSPSAGPGLIQPGVGLPGRNGLIPGPTHPPTVQPLPGRTRPGRGSNGRQIPQVPPLGNGRLDGPLAPGRSGPGLPVAGQSQTPPAEALEDWQVCQS